MRQGQQHQKRMRGRNNNRKGPNPLNRSFESNGPDVKIRGTAAHIAEKYVQLARDAQSSGDPISAENYLQHAEHYFRIVAANQPQFPQQHQTGGQQGFGRSDDEDLDDETGEHQVNGFEGHPQNSGERPQTHQQNAPQSYQGEGQPRDQRPQGGAESGLPAFITGGADGAPQGQERGDREGYGRNRRNRRFGRYGRNGGPGEAGGQDGAPNAEPEVTPGE